jgi:hypothetical protein
MVIVNATGSTNFINLNYKEASALPYQATNIIQIELIQKKIIPIISTESSNKKETSIWEIVPDLQADLTLFNSQSPKHFCLYYTFFQNNQCQHT